MRLNPRHIAIALAVSGATVATAAEMQLVIPFKLLVHQLYCLMQVLLLKSLVIPSLNLKHPVVGSGGSSGGFETILSRCW